MRGSLRIIETVPWLLNMGSKDVLGDFQRERRPPDAENYTQDQKFLISCMATSPIPDAKFALLEKGTMRLRRRSSC
jgi:hypothetical protein